MLFLKEYRLYNVLFPLWMLILFPQTWLYVIPANFIVDSAVLFLGAYFICREKKKYVFKKSILKVFVLGFLSDFVGSAFLLAGLFVGSLTGNAFIEDIFVKTSNGAQSVGGFFALAFAVLLSAVCIFFADYKIAFRKLEIEDSEKKKLALVLALATAPYTFFLPLY